MKTDTKLVVGSKMEPSKTHGGLVMIEKPYFVILNHPNGSYVPLENDNGMMFFDSEIMATSAAESSILGSEYGFEVFELGGGC
jgi:hypothetical protein